MEREELEKRYQECIKKIAEYHCQGKDINMILREIDKIKQRMLCIDIAKAIREYKVENNISEAYKM